jgi:hypothetical protein
MKSVLVSLVAVGACLVILSPSVASAAANPSGTGQPNQTCQNFVVSGFVLATPGNSANSPGSVFNEPGFGNGGTSSGGTGGNAYNAAGAPSQYDVACFQHSQMP